MDEETEKQARIRFGHFLRSQAENLYDGGAPVYPNQAVLGDALGISQGHVSKWFRGEVAAHTPEMLRKWANALRLPVARILIEAGYLTHGDFVAADPTSHISPMLILLGDRLPALVNEDDVDLVVRLAWAAREWVVAHGAPEVRAAGQTTQVETTAEEEPEERQRATGSSP
jgi:transcriptional regulator with XRE-family HTH domain